MSEGFHFLPQRSPRRPICVFCTHLSSPVHCANQALASARSAWSVWQIGVFLGRRHSCQCAGVAWPSSAHSFAMGQPSAVKDDAMRETIPLPRRCFSWDAGSGNDPWWCFDAGVTSCDAAAIHCQVRHQCCKRLLSCGSASDAPGPAPDPTPSPPPGPTPGPSPEPTQECGLLNPKPGLIWKKLPDLSDLLKNFESLAQYIRRPRVARGNPDGSYEPSSRGQRRDAVSGP